MGISFLTWFISNRVNPTKKDTALTQEGLMVQLIFNPTTGHCSLADRQPGPGEMLITYTKEQADELLKRERMATSSPSDSPTDTLDNIPPEEPKVHAQESSNSQPFQGERYPQTRLRLLSSDDVKGLSIAQLRYAINEVYARYGATFPNTPDIQRQFERFSWYHSNPSLTFEAIDRMMSEVEKKNVKLLALRRESKRGR
jgi:hypothetical protein